MGSILLDQAYFSFAIAELFRLEKHKMIDTSSLAVCSEMCYALFDTSLQRWPLVLVVLTTASAALWLATRIIRSNKTEQRIRDNGGHGSRYKSYLPWSVDFVCSILFHVIKDNDLYWWHTLFVNNAKPTRPYTVEVNALGGQVIFTADPENIKAMLADQFLDYGKGDNLDPNWRAVVGHSILATDGDKWRRGRKLIRNQLGKERIADTSCMDRHVDILLAHITAASNAGQTVDAKELFYRLTIDISTDFLLGESVNTLSSNTAGTQIADALDFVQRFLIILSMANKARCLLPKRTFRRKLQQINDYLDSVVQRALNIPIYELEEASKSKQLDFLHALVMETRDAGELRDQIFAMLIGGRDTTACALSWLFYHLSLNPAIVSKLRTEIADTAKTPSLPTYTELKSMRLLQQCIKETLRLHPSVPYNARYSLRDTSLPRGGGADGCAPFAVLAGTPIVYSIQMLHLSDLPGYPADGPDPAVFAPERWDSWHPRIWTYIPFNGGPRLCVGQQLALTEIAYTAARILQRFDIIEWAGAQESPYLSASRCIGTENAVGRFLASQRISMRGEIVLTPVSYTHLTLPTKRIV